MISGPFSPSGARRGIPLGRKRQPTVTSVNKFFAQNGKCQYHWLKQAHSENIRGCGPVRLGGGGHSSVCAARVHRAAAYAMRRVWPLLGASLRGRHATAPPMRLSEKAGVGAWRLHAATAECALTRMHWLAEKTRYCGPIGMHVLERRHRAD
ncbi:MAG TPA: hypothetical protein DEP05_06315 [Betaproteobacteria bacterium]|nr:hypothetical protein [Betaproteobacteria bacterium]